MLTPPLNSLENLNDSRSGAEAPANKPSLSRFGAREHVGALFSGLPKALRDKGILMVLQGWFDDSGKGQPPVYLLAGYVSEKETWETFADEWQAELCRPPCLPYMHVAESQIFKGISNTERIDRTLRFVDIIASHHLRAVAFLLKHSDYNDFFRIITGHPLMRSVERRMLRNPYFLAFQRILTLMLSLQAKTLAETREHHMIEVLFDEGMDRTKRLELAFDQWVNVVREREPTWLDFLINKKRQNFVTTKFSCRCRRPICLRGIFGGIASRGYRARATPMIRFGERYEGRQTLNCSYIRNRIS